MTRRDIDEQVSDLAVRYRLKVIDDGIDVEAGHKWRGWLDDPPGLTDELAETANGSFRVNFVE
jgi:hypothetical protein